MGVLFQLFKKGIPNNEATELTGLSEEEIEKHENSK